jgi:hypothetical protein
MYLTITSDIDTVHLQEDLDKLASWEQAWMMSFYPEKCNFLTVSRKRNIAMWTFHLKSDDIVTPRYVADVTCSSWCPCDM